MAKPDLGIKRLCANCGAKFYDLGKTPIVCPKCETVFEPAVSTRARADTTRAAAKSSDEAPEKEDAELVSLEEADAESQGKKPKANLDVDIDEDDIEIEGDDEDDTFIEDEEEGDDDVTDIIGERDQEEET